MQTKGTEWIFRKDVWNLQDFAAVSDGFAGLVPVGSEETWALVWGHTGALNREIKEACQFWISTHATSSILDDVYIIKFRFRISTACNSLSANNSLWVFFF